MTQHLTERDVRDIATDLDGVTPTFHPIGSLSNVMREDTERESFTQEVALENAPKQQDGSFLIPSILGEGGDR